MTGHDGGGVLLGGYDPAKREHEVFTRFRLSCEGIRKENLHKKDLGASDSQQSKGHDKRKGTGTEDMTTIQLNSILAEVDVLDKNVKDFVGPHFTRNYRTFQGDCTKFQSDLDRLEVTGRDDIRKKRRDAIIRIEELAKELAKKTHEDGKSCPECEGRE